jgi:hypothetical protein
MVEKLSLHVPKFVTSISAAFSHKRAGNKSDLAILIRLQCFVDEFARRIHSTDVMNLRP